MPDYILNSLAILADTAVPFKVQLLRGVGTGQGHSRSQMQRKGQRPEYDGWSENLTVPLTVIPSAESYQCSIQTNDGSDYDYGQRPPRVPTVDRRQNHQRMQQRHNYKDSPVTFQRSPTYTIVDSVERSPLQPTTTQASEEARRWLTTDIERVAELFAQEMSRELSGTEQDGSMVVPLHAGVGGVVIEKQACCMDVTVKLELLKKGKCPRFHLDKVTENITCTEFYRNSIEILCVHKKDKHGCCGIWK